MNTSPVRVGIIGLGRSGWSIHALGLQLMPEHYQIVAVADLITERRAEAEQTFGCRAYAGYGELLADREVELVIVAPPSYLHAVYTIAALQAGKAVVCEKPMAENLADADGMLAAARRTGSLFTMFQNRRYEASYLKVREIIASGVLGRIFQIKLTVHSFSRRWDWQTLRAFAGGQLRNNGVHYLDQSLQLMDLASELAARSSRPSSTARRMRWRWATPKTASRSCSPRPARRWWIWSWSACAPMPRSRGW